MISSNIHMDYLKPEYWTNLGNILSCLNPKKQILHILKDNADKIRGVTSDHKILALEEFLNSDQLNIQGIFEEYEEIEEIRVYTMLGLKNYYKKVQDPFVYQMDIDNYLIYMYQLQENTDGIQIYTRKKEKRCYLEYFKIWIDQNKKDGAFLFWLTKQGEPFFNCILEVKSGDLVRLTTSDRYQEAYNDYDQVSAKLNTEFPGLAYCFKMDVNEFKRKLTQFYHNQTKSE
ncbi:MAG: hypothetical protein WBI07_06010 [Mobilitalea sp.]